MSLHNVGVEQPQVRDCQQPQKLDEAGTRMSRRAFRGCSALPTLDLGLVREYISSVLSHPVCGHQLQQLQK